MDHPDVITISSDSECELNAMPKANVIPHRCRIIVLDDDGDYRPSDVEGRPPKRVRRFGVTVHTMLNEPGTSGSIAPCRFDLDTEYSFSDIKPDVLAALSSQGL